MDAVISIDIAFQVILHSHRHLLACVTTLRTAERQRLNGLNFVVFNKMKFND